MGQGVDKVDVPVSSPVEAEYDEVVASSTDGLPFRKSLPGPRMSLISTLRNGRNGFPQKGQVVFRLESSAVQPAMISSSYTRQSQVLQREQLEISSSMA